jgi:hypothetical protein
VHPVLTTEAAPPDEPTSPLIVVGGGVFVQVTAPPPLAAALSTAKLDAAPNERAPDDELALASRWIGGALIRELESLLQAAESMTKVAITAAANLVGTGILVRRSRKFFTCMRVSIGPVASHNHYFPPPHPVAKKQYAIRARGSTTEMQKGGAPLRTLRLLVS